MRNKTGAFIGQALKNLFSKPMPRQVAERGDYWTPGNRGHITIDEKQCILCGMCSRRCPSSAIQVDRPGKSWSINRFNCVQCGICTEVCPKKCLFMNEGFPATGTDRLAREEHHVEPPKRPAAKPPVASSGKPTAAGKPETAVGKAEPVKSPAAGQADSDNTKAGITEAKETQTAPQQE